MTYAVFRLMIFAFITLTASSLAARALGSTQSSSQSLPGFSLGCEEKPQPCWHGIVPGTTSFDTARQLLSRYGYTNERALDQITTVFDAPAGSNLTSVNLIHQGNQLWMVGLYPRARLSLSTAISALGSPDGMVANRPHVVMGLAYGPKVRVALYESAPGRISPFAAHIKYVTLTSEPVDVLPWHGFVPVWRYCQLEPTYPGCA